MSILRLTFQPPSTRILSDFGSIAVAEVLNKAVITGGSSGIGKALVEQFARHPACAQYFLKTSAI